MEIEVITSEVPRETQEVEVEEMHEGEGKLPKSCQIEGVITKTNGNRSSNYQNAVKYITQSAEWTCTRVQANCFIGLCAVTWATAVLLGGMLSSIPTRQFVAVCVLLVAQAIQFGAMVSCHRFLPEPRLIGASSLTTISRYGVFCILECLYIPAFIATTILDSLIPSMANFTLVEKLSTLIFYFISLCNASVTSSGLQLYLVNFKSLQWPCLLNYHDKLVKVGLLEGLEKQRQVQVVDAIFDMMAREFRVQSKKEDVHVSYESMIEFVYEDERGFEATLKAMQSTDRYVQEAATHIVGFWADSNRVLQKEQLYFERSLLNQLVELSTNSVGPIGVAAARSIQKLIKQAPRGLMAMEARTSHLLVQMLVKRVVELVDIMSLQDSFQFNLLEASHVPLSKSCHQYLQLLYICKALTLLLSADNQLFFTKCFTDHDQKQIDEFFEKLLIIFKNSHCSWKRLQVIVGHALQQLRTSTTISLTESIVHMQLKAQPEGRIDIFEDEKQWLDSLVGRYNVQDLQWNLNVISIESTLNETRQKLSVPQLEQMKEKNKALAMLLVLMFSSFSLSVYYRSFKPE